MWLVLALGLACGGAATALPTAIPETPTPGLTAAPAATAGPTQALPTRTQTPSDPGQQDGPASGPMVRVGDEEFTVELAVTREEQIQGLSDRPSLAPHTGMLFIYKQQSRHDFWMKNMHFPLDMIWISADCTVADASLNVPPPGPDQTLDQLPLYSSGAPVKYVLEINGGEAAANGIQPGVGVEFAGNLAGRFGC